MRTADSLRSPKSPKRFAQSALSLICAALLCLSMPGCLSNTEQPINDNETPMGESPSDDGSDRPADQQSPADEEALAAEEERSTDPEELGYLPGQIIVVYEDDATETDKQSAIDSLGATETDKTAEFESGDVSTLEISDDMTVETAVEQAEAENSVKYAVPNYIVESLEDMTDDSLEDGDESEGDAGFSEIPASEEPVGETHAAIAGDELTSYQWYLDFVKAPQAWKLLAAKSSSVSPVKVAVLDTGASLTHPDLKNVLNTTDSVEVVWTDGTKISSWKSAPLRGDGYANGSKNIEETSSHGTHVCGIIAGQAGNGGIAGVASGAGTAVANKLVDLVAIDAFSLATAEASGAKKASATLMDLVFSMQYSRDKGCRVINMSLGIQSPDPAVADLFEDLCAELTQKNNIVIVAAAGNSNTTVKCYPAACDSVLGVISVSERANSAATSQTFLFPAWGDGKKDILRSHFSNYGSWCDISAPGENIYSSVISGGVSDGYRTMQGTSMACPVVTAAAAMTIAANPSLTAPEVADILCDTSIDLYAAGKDDQTGCGYLDIEAAVSQAISASKSRAASTAQIDLKNATVSIPSVTYSGSSQIPKVIVKLGSATLSRDTDYTVSYSTGSMKNAGSYTVTVSGKGKYIGSRNATFTIQPASLASAQITASNQTYTGALLSPSPTVVLGGKTLTQQTDYKVSYSNNINVGTGTVIVKGTGNYIGTARGSFAISKADISPASSTTGKAASASNSAPVSVTRKNLSLASVSGIGSQYTYTGKSISPVPILKYNGLFLHAGTDYTVGYNNNRSIGTGSVVLTGIGSYKGSVQIKFSIKAPTINIPKNLKAKSGRKAFTVNWKSPSGGATSYELQYATNKKFSSSHKIKVSGKRSSVKHVVKKLKAKKTYYVRVRAIKQVGGQQFYSAWSKAVKVTTKK